MTSPTNEILGRASAVIKAKDRGSDKADTMTYLRHNSIAAMRRYDRHARLWHYLSA